MDVDSFPLPPRAPVPPTVSTTTSTNNTFMHRSIKIHPLAIIGISDHHTRVISGGSALPSSSSVMGLLFGYHSHNLPSTATTNLSNMSSNSSITAKTATTTTVIVDAEEMECGGGGGSGNDNARDHHHSIQQKIELHQKVFPTHQVVGWYRVVVGNTKNDVVVVDPPLQPTPEDMLLTQMEIARYCLYSSSSSSGGGSDDKNRNNAYPTLSPLFVVMDASSSDNDNLIENRTLMANTTATTTALEELEKDNELPLTVYDTLTTMDVISEKNDDTTTATATATAETRGSGVIGSTNSYSSFVFYHVDFELEMYEPERIAVERVLKTQPPTSQLWTPSRTTTFTSSSSPLAAAAASTTTTPTIIASGRREEHGGGRGTSTSKSFSNETANRKMGKKCKKDTPPLLPSQQPSKKTSVLPASSVSSLVGERAVPTQNKSNSIVLDTQLLSSLPLSIRALNLRIRVLLEYLEKRELMMQGDNPPTEMDDDALLRSIDSLVQQLPLVLAALEEECTSSSSSLSLMKNDHSGELQREYSNAMLTSYLACTAKTANAVHVLCEKFRVICGDSGKNDPLLLRRPLH